MISSVKENIEEEKILSDEVMKSPHKKRRELSQRKKDRLNEGMKIWTAFYRLNIHRFALDFLGLNLYPFQIILLYMMNIMYSTCLICARGK